MDAIYLVNLCSWSYFRLYVYRARILYSAFYEALLVGSSPHLIAADVGGQAVAPGWMHVSQTAWLHPPYPGWLACNLFLWLLQGLHVWWFLLILRIACKSRGDLRGGAKAEYEGESSQSEGEGGRPRTEPGDGIAQGKEKGGVARERSPICIRRRAK